MEWIYRALMQRRRAANLERRAREIAPCPIISIGNLTTGGVGKTPAVQWLAREMQNQGFQVGVASRGYGGARSEKGALVSDGKTTFLSAREAGDEAITHARNLPGAVVSITKDRHLATQLCVQNGAQIVILDDGFQFWSLPRAFDLVLLDARKPFGNGHLLPFGRLREEPPALARADAVLLTRCNRATSDELQASRDMIQRCTGAPIFESNHAPRDLRDEKSGAVVGLDYLKRREIKAFAGLADNAQFYDALQKLGASRLHRLRRERGDHYFWQQSDFNWFENAPSINAHQTEIFDTLPIITTEKDAVKVSPDWFGGALFSLRIALEIEDSDALLSLIRGKISAP